MFSVGIWSNDVPYKRAEWWIPMVRRMRGAGCGHWLLKIVSWDATLFNGDHLSPAVRYAQEQGLHVWGWGYCRDARYVDPAADGSLLGSRAAALGMNGVVLDIEREWAADDHDSAMRLLSAVRAAFPGRPVYASSNSAMRLLSAVRAAFPGRPVYASSYSTMSLHPEFPWAAFAGVDGWIPQVYQVPQDQWARRAYDEFRTLGKGLILDGIGSTQLGNAQDTDAFLRQCKALDIACDLWEYSEIDAAMWEKVAEATGMASGLGERSTSAASVSPVAPST